MFYVDENGRYALKGTENWPLEWYVTQHVVSIIIITVLLIIAFFVINRKIKNANPLEKPKGILLLVEMFVEMIDGFTLNMLGEKMRNIAPYIGFLGIYLFIANVFGLFGFAPPTASLSVTLTFGLTTFFMVRYYGIKFKGLDHFKSLFQPILLTPINIIGELAVPISLSVRLFGNILSGAVIMALIYGGIALWIGWFSTGFAAILPFFHVYFDLFSGLIQTVVFILLSTVFISNATD